MPTVNLAPDTEQQAIQRRRLLAQALQQQAMQPIEGPNVPGANISPWQGVSQIANALMAGLINRKLDKRQSALDTKQDTERTAATNAMLQALIPQTPGSSMSVPMAPTQAAPVPIDIGSDVLGPNQEAQQPEGARMLDLPADQSGRAMQLSSLAKALASRDPQAQQMAQVTLQDILSRGKEDRSNQFDIAKLLQQQSYGAGQNALTQEGENARQQAALSQQAKEAEANRAAQNIDPLSPQGIAGRIQIAQATAQPPAQRNIDPLSPEGIAAAVQRSKLEEQNKPPSTTQTDNRMDKSYQFNVGQLNTLEKPVGEAITRLGRLQDTIGQATPQADALLAPELLTVMAGGQGSGLRMNEAEIARVIGGRSNFESLKAALNKWQLDPSKALSVTPAQRQQIQSLVKTVNDKLLEKQTILNEANQKLIGATSVEDHRKAVDEARRKLSTLDQGGGKKADPLGIR